MSSAPPRLLLALLEGALSIVPLIDLGALIASILCISATFLKVSTTAATHHVLVTVMYSLPLRESPAIPNLGPLGLIG